MTRLTDREKQESVRYLEGDKPLPEKYRFLRRRMWHICIQCLNPSNSRGLETWEEMMAKKIEVKGSEVAVISKEEQDYISLTDIARYKEAERIDHIIQNWLRNRNTIEFLGIWEQLNNPDFNPVEFDGFKRQAGLNSFTLTPKQWIEKTNAIGIVSKSGRYGGTYAHKDIAFEFASWISVEFNLPT